MTQLPDIIDPAAQLLNVETGELLDPTPANAVRVKAAIRKMRDRLSDLSAQADGILVEQAQRLGTKTLHTDAGQVTLTGGRSLEYDIDELRGALLRAGLPDERVQEAIKVTVEYRVNRGVVRQLAAANEAYAEAIAEAERWVEKPWRATVKVSA